MLTFVISFSHQLYPFIWGMPRKVLKSHNRQVEDSGGSKPYQRVDTLTWSEAEKKHGKTIKIKSFPAEHKVKVFRVVLSTQRTDYVVTNEMEQNNTEVVHDLCGF